MKKNLLHRFIRSRPHLSLAIALGALVAYLLPGSFHSMTRALIAWNVGVWTYLPAMLWVMTHADHNKLRSIASKQDESAGLVLATLSVASVISLTAIVSELSQVAQLPSDERALHYALTALTIFGSWFLVGVLFCFHYAHLYYRGSAAVLPLKFPDEGKEPDYWDFLYFAFTIAVAVQTSDVTVMTRNMRKLVIGQSILSFFFNLVVLGLSINIAAGVVKP